MTEKKPDEFGAKETAQRMEKALQRAFTMKPEPHKPSAKKQTRKPKGKTK